MRTLVLSLLAIPFAVTAQAPSPVIDTIAIRSHTQFLADDLLLGRGTGTPESEVAARYLRAACQQIGLEPIGTSYLLPFGLLEARVDTVATRLTVQAGGRIVALSTPGDFVLNVGRFASRQSLRGPAILVGDETAVRADSSPAPVGNAIAVVEGVLRPDLAPRLAARGFAGALYLTPDLPTFDLYRRSRGPTRLAHADSTVASSFLPPLPTAIVAPSVLRALALGARRFGSRVVGLEADIAMDIATEHRSLVGHNVGCRLPGHDPLRRGALAYTAHYDHLGVGEPDQNGDSIYNGFSDNAAGVAMLLAVAGAYRQHPPQHSVLFFFLSGEERGLLGSDALVHAPPWPLDDLIGVINLDAGAPPAPPTSWRIAGGDDSPLGALAVEVATRHGWTAGTSAATPNSDYYPFWRSGVRSIFIIPGTEPYEGMTAEASAALKTRWDRYHRADDHWSADFPFSGLERYARYAWLVGWELDRRQP